MDNKKIKIAEVLGNCKSGGVISLVMNFYRNLDKNKFEIDFFMYDKSPYEKEILSLGGKVFYYEKFSTKTLKNYFLENKYDIVHSHLTTLSFFSMYSAKKANVPVRICHSHSTTNYREGVRYIIKNMLKPLCKIYPTNLAGCSKLSCDWLYGKDNNAFILHNAIDCNKYKKLDNTSLKKQLGIENKKVVGFVGRLEKQKNVGYLIDIFNKLGQKYADTVLLIVGEGSKKQQLVKQIEKYNLDNVIFIDECFDVEKYYSIMDVFCLPSLYEGLPLVAIEAQAMGIPCLLSTNITTEVKVTDLVNFISLKDKDSWVNSIENILDNPPKNNLSIVGSCYDITYEVKQLENYYENLVKEHNA